VARDRRQQTIAERLSGRTVLLTGGSGFVGKAILATCLRELPDLAAIRVLLRAPDDEAARRRLTTDILTTAPFEALNPADVALALETGRLTARAADLLEDHLGRDDFAPLADVDVAIHCAASVSFEQPLDEMIELNVLGTRRLVGALREAGASPHFVHVSTAYAAGCRTGLVLERASGLAPGEPDVDLEGELAAARAWRAELETESRLPAHQHRFVADARQEIGPAGAPAVGARAEQLRREWVVDELTARGRERSRALGWPDAYGLSKALAERVLLDEAPGKLTIVRPTIIESALRTPYPGWIEGVKVADPVILAYAAGMIPRFPGNRSVRLDLVPVDLVTNACVVAAACPPEDDLRLFAVASGSRNPLTIEETTEAITEYFSERPLAGEDQLPVEVPEWRFSSSRRVLGTLDRGRRAIRGARGLLDRVALPRVDDAERRLHREQRRLERLRRLAEIYGPYTELDCMFDDREGRALLEGLDPDDQSRFDFDTEAIDWPTYLKEVHLPALRELARPPRRPVPTTAAPKPVSALPDGPPALAFFDVEGVVLDATVVHFYAWLRGRTMPALDRALWLTTLGAKATGWLTTDRRSRASFNRAFYRQYRGLPADDLRDQARAALSDFILPRIQQAAVRRIRAHRARGDRVVFVTGALDFLVEPLEHLCDELVAARLLQRRGAFTGELAEPPLSGDGRASLAARLAAEQSIDLSDCYAYGDSISDLPLLEIVGHPAAVNPDFRLAREARRRGWPMLEWSTEPGARSMPPASTEVAV
jgi:HAD superfamily hydrolase (TIGR01490 family)